MFRKLFLPLAVLLAISLPTAAQGPALSGTVVDENGEPLIGAGVLVKGTTNGTITDFDGNFVMSSVTYPVTVVVSYIGYDDKEYTFTGNETMPIKLSMDAVSNALDEVVVVGFGTQKKVNLTGAVGTVSGKEINNRPVTTAAQALQGADPSLVMSMGNGSIEGNEYSVSIRGQISISDNSTASPLVMVDGIESSLNLVNPNDIESVSILKDASACAIYGAAASAGVILITTKSGKSGDMKVSYNGRAGVAFNTTSTDFLTTGYDYVNLSNEFTKNSNKGYNAWNYTDAEMQMLYERRNDTVEDPSRPWVIRDEDTGKYRYLGNFDWYGYMFKRVRPETEHNVTITGGSDKIRYFVSGRYLYREGVFNAGAEDKYNGVSFRAKLDADVKPWMHYTGNFSLEWNKYDYGGFWEQDGTQGLSSQGIMWNITQNISPTLVPINPDGTTMMYTNGIQFGDSPIASGRGGVFTDGRNKNARTVNYWTLTNRLVFDLIPNSRDLTFTAEYSYRRRDNLGTYRSYPTANTWDKNMQNIVDFTNGSIYDFYQENRTYANIHSVNAFFNYSHTWAKSHNFSAVLGMQFQDYRSSSLVVKQRGSLSEALSFINMEQGTIEKCVESNTSYSTLGIFVRANYDYKGKYLVEFSGRYDGSSRFARDARFAFFPSASVGWRMSEENFWSSIRDIWSNSKLRFSYGTLGNQQVPNYSYIQTISTSQMDYTFDGKTKAGKASVPDPISDGLTWETVITYNLGVDWGFFRSRLNFSADFFIRDTKDMLCSASTLPSVYGATEPKVNGADMRTTGYELSLSWKDNIGSVVGSPMSYSVSASLGDNTSKITRYDNPEKNLSKTYYEGMTVGEIWGYQVEGLFKTDREAAEYQANINDRAVNARVYDCGIPEMAKLRAGDVKFIDADGNGVINNGKNTANDPGDRKVIGNRLPRYNYSFKGDLDWYGVNLSILFQGVGKCDWMPDANCSYFWGLYGFPASSFIPSNFASQTWTPENRNAYFPRRRGYQTSSSGSMSTASDYFLQDASYIRLKNITIGYTIPLKGKALEKLRVYITGENLWYWSPMMEHSTYVDPEVATSGSSTSGCIYPFSRTVSAGIDLTF